MLDRADSRELTELLAWERIKSGAKAHDNKAGKAGIKAALQSMKRKSGKGAKPRKERKA